MATRSTLLPAAIRPPRDFTYIKSRQRHLSEYEAVTCYTQPDPGGFDQEGWFLRTPEGRTAWIEESTKLSHPHWFDFRDPASQWQRSYVRMQAEQERSIARACEDAACGGAFESFDPDWAVEILAGHYRVWSFFEYGLFRAFAVAQREALSDTLGNAFCFEAFDRMRYAQAIVIYLMDLEDSIVGLSDPGAKERWLEEPSYQPLRSLVEHLIALEDWAELAVVTNLLVDPVVSDVGISKLVGRFGPFHGDYVTPYLIGTAERDRRRNRAWTEELVRMVTAVDLDAAETNREVIQGWLDSWTPVVRGAVSALAPLYELPSIQVMTFEDALKGALERQHSILRSLDLSTKSGA